MLQISDSEERDVAEKKIGLQKCIVMAQPGTGVPRWNSGAGIPDRADFF